jgi:hypothetical protein
MKSEISIARQFIEYLYNRANGFSYRASENKVMVGNFDFVPGRKTSLFTDLSTELGLYRLFISCRNLEIPNRIIAQVDISFLDLSSKSSGIQQVGILNIPDNSLELDLEFYRLQTEIYRIVNLICHIPKKQ